MTGGRPGLPAPLRTAVAAAPAVDQSVAEFRPEPRSLPSFHVWTLGCQMNQSDSEEMAGQLLAAGCARAPSLEAADLVVINTCAVREHAEAKVIGRQGLLAELEASAAGDARRPHRLRRPGGRTRRPGPPIPGGRHVPPTGRRARAGAAPRPRVCPGAGRPADRRHSRHDRSERSAGQRGRSPCRQPRHRPVGRSSGSLLDHLRLAADRLRLRQDLHLLHRAVQPRPGAEPAVRRHRRRGPRDRRSRLRGADPARPERQQLRPRPAGGGAFRAHRHASDERAPARSGGPAGPGRAAARDRRASAPRTAGRRFRACASSPRIRGISPTA